MLWHSNYKSTVLIMAYSHLPTISVCDFRYLHHDPSLKDGIYETICDLRATVTNMSTLYCLWLWCKYTLCLDFITGTGKFIWWSAQLVVWFRSILLMSAFCGNKTLYLALNCICCLRKIHNFILNILQQDEDDYKISGTR